MSDKGSGGGAEINNYELEINEGHSANDATNVFINTKAMDYNTQEDLNFGFQNGVPTGGYIITF